MSAGALAATLAFYALTAARDTSLPGDRDGDGVPDNVDVCPDTFGPVEGRGCPPAPLARVSSDRERIILERDVAFTDESAKILPRAWPTLDDVARAMKENPSFARVRIVGRADGSKLSLERAEAMRAYLMKHGVAGARLEAGVAPSGPAPSPAIQLAIIRLR